MVSRTSMVIPAILLSALSFATAASATPPLADVAMSAEEGDELYRRGNTAYAQKDWPEAYRLYLAAWNLKKSFDIAGNLGDVELFLGKPRDAAEHLAYSLRIFPPNGKPEARQRTRTRLAEARTQVLAMTIHSAPAGAEILVDGRAIGKTPLDGEVFVSPGSHTVEAKLEGYVTAKQTVQGTKGASQEVRLTLAPARTESESPPQEGSGPHLAILLGGTALAISGVALGIGFAVASTNNADDAGQKTDALRPATGPSACGSQPAACADIDRDRRASDTLADGAKVSFVLAGAAMAGTVAYGLLTRQAKPTAGLHVVPAMGVRQGGVLVVGRW